MEKPKPKQRIALQMIMAHAIKPELPKGKPNHLIALDPGETTGWATFHENGLPSDTGHVSGDVVGVTDLLWGGVFEEPADIVVFETYIILNAKAHQFSTVPTLQVIGAIRAYAHSNGAKLVGQHPDIKDAAENFSNVRPEGKHETQHWVDGFNHGYFYNQTRGIYIPRVLWPEG